MGRDPREFCIMSKEFVDDGSGHVKGINIKRLEWTKNSAGGWDMKEIQGSEEFFPAELVLISMGFLSPEEKVTEGLIELDGRKNFKTPPGKYTTNLEGVFAAGDCRRGQSLIVWGINEGRQCARDIDTYLTGVGSQLPVTGGIVKRPPYELLQKAGAPAQIITAA
jgi:glutamate synthase (NADPH/NADH)